MSYRVVIKVMDYGDGDFRQAAGRVAEHLDEASGAAGAFHGFTAQSFNPSRTILFSIYLDADDDLSATLAAHDHLRSAVIAAGDATRGWAAFVHPAELELVTV